jgi:hypothetical protein
MAVAALRSFLIESGIETLPAAHMKKPPKVKPSTYMTWEQATAIGAAASRPYNLIFKLMQHCGWGIGEFLKFNTTETWARLKKYFEQTPNALYFRFDYGGRKSNELQWFSCPPKTILQEIMSLVPVPIGSKSRRNENLVLDMSRYGTAKQYLESAWRTALKRAPVLVEGQPTVHELRDTFITRGAFVNARPEPVEFVTGHGLDPNEYQKCFRNEAFVWSEINKILSVEDPDEQRKRAILDNARLLGMGEGELNQIQDMFVKKLGHMTSDQLLEEVQKHIDAKRRQGATKPSATDGGKTCDALLVDENDLVQYLEAGWELVSVINSKVAIRRPTR